MVSVARLLNCHFLVVTTNLQPPKAKVNNSQRIALLFLGLLTEKEFV